MSTARDLVAVDLGKRVSGLAWFESGRLVDAVEVRVRSGLPGAMAAALIARVPYAMRRGLWVAERMLDYQGKGARASRLDALRAVAEQLQARGIALQLRPAWQWKGGTPKHVTRRRVLRVLGADERPSQVTKETIDAIGLGLFELGRVGRGVTTPRGRSRHRR